MELFSDSNLLNFLRENPDTSLAGFVVIFGVSFMGIVVIEEIIIRLFGIWGGRVLFALGTLGFGVTFVSLFFFGEALDEPAGKVLFLGCFAVFGMMWFIGSMIIDRILHPELFSDD